MQLYARYDNETASQVTDAERFFASVNRANHALVQHQMKLSPDLAANVDELIELARLR